MKLHAKDRISIVKRTLCIVVPLVILFLVLFGSYEKSLKEQASLLLQTEQEKGNAIIANQLEAVFSQFVSDLLTVFDSAEFTRYTRDTGVYNHSELEQLFLRIANKKSYINHIRLLDASGMEIIKVDHYPNTLTVLSDPSRLENRKDSELFAFAQSNDANTLYISPIGLESRQNLHDDHTGPAMVLALPAYTDGRFFGLVIIDYDACFLLSFLRDYQEAMTKNIIFGLVSNNGDWIHRGGQACSNFIQSDQGSSSLFAEAPDLKSLLFASGSGFYLSEERSYGYQAVMPLATQTLHWYPDEGRLWSVVSYYSLAEVPALSQLLLLQLPFLKWILGLLLFLLGIVFVVMYQLRRADQVQMQVSSLISEYSGNGILVTDDTHRITFCNHAFEVLCGYMQDELIGKGTQDFLPCLTPSSVKNLSYREGPVSRPIWIRHKNGNEYLTNRTETRAKPTIGRDAYTVGVYTSSSWNVPDFIAYVRDNEVELPVFLLSGYGVKAQTSYCLLIHLKHQFERVSHYSLITESAFSIQLSLFISSMLGQAEPVYAFSADTYVALLHEDDSRAVQPLIHSLLLGIEQQCTTLAKFIQNQATCGYSQYSGGEVSIPTLLMQASMASRMIEDSHSCKCLQFDERVHNQYQRKQAILAEIPGAFSSSSLFLCYQAQVDVQTDGIVGAEALIRWIHPELGFIAPDEFIPLMEEHHMIAMLGEFVIRTAIAFLKANQSVLRAVKPAFSLAINLSAEEFSNPVIIDFIGDELDRQGVEPSLLTVELTERTAVESLQTTGMFMERLRSIGVGIAIDDFGTGFSSLSYLLELTMEKLKIDRSFIASYPDSDAIIIYKAVLMLAKELGITVIAEGVETEEQLHFLRQIGCNQYQGYLFSKAVPEAEFLKQLEG